MPMQAQISKYYQLAILVCCAQDESLQWGAVTDLTYASNLEDGCSITASLAGFNGQRREQKNRFSHPGDLKMMTLY